MKAKVAKRFMAFVMSVLLMLVTSVSAFAAEVPVDGSEFATVVANPKTTTVASYDRNDFGTCPAHGELDLYITLRNTADVKTLYFSVSANETDLHPICHVTVSLAPVGGNYFYHHGAYTNPGEYYWNFRNLPTGDYRIHIESSSDENLFCTVGWVGG